MKIKPNLPKFKIRCSAWGKIMGGAFNKPTDKQIARIAELTQKEKRTAIQNIELMELIGKRDSQPKLQAGAITYLHQWAIEQIMNRTKEFSNKYTEKGRACEPGGIILVSEVMNYGEIDKNTVRKEDEWSTGECDLALSKIVEDVKCSWEPATFPLFATELPESDYEYQLRGYMALWDKPRAAVNYCLIAAPEELINQEAFYRSRKAGLIEVDDELYQEVLNKMTFQDIPKELRMKRFEFEHDDFILSKMRNQVELCRAYLDDLTYEMMITTIKSEMVT